MTPSLIALDERADDLQRMGLRVLQKRGGFRFGLDAVLLSEFAAPRRQEHAVDLGTGTGVIPLLLYGREPSITVDAVEIDEGMADMAHRSMLLNHVESAIRVRRGDVRALDLPAGRYTLATCNPPYYEVSAAVRIKSDARRSAVTELHGTLHDFLRAAARALQNGGRACVVYPAPRLLALLDGLRAVRLEPKKLQFVQDTAARAPKLVLCEAMRGAQPGLTVAPPFILRDEDGLYTQAAKRAYNQV